MKYVSISVTISVQTRLVPTSVRVMMATTFTHHPDTMTLNLKRERTAVNRGINFTWDILVCVSESTIVTEYHLTVRQNFCYNQTFYIMGSSF